MKKFAEEFLIDRNATQAAIRAGYSKTSAEKQGHLLTRNDKVIAYIEQREQEIKEATCISHEWVTERLIEVVKKCMQEVEVEKWDHDARCVTGTGEYVFDAKGANQALQLLGKNIGMFKDNVQVTGAVEIKIKPPSFAEGKE